MKYPIKKKTWPLPSVPPMRAACVMLGVFAMLVPPLTGIAEEKEKPLAEIIESGQQEQEPKFEYFIEDRKDPFVPFLTERATTSDVDMNEIVEPDKVLTGMQLFEPGQLTLVALMELGESGFAMVEDTTGKGYVISEGTKIGKRGVVKEIRPNQVIIEETAQTRAGKKIVSKVVMVLKKEGEE